MAIRTISGESLPSDIYFTGKNEIDPEEQKVSCCGWCFQAPLRKLGEKLRNAFYLPLYNQKIDFPFVVEQSLAGKICSALERADVSCPKELEEIRSHFSVNDVHVHLSGTPERVFKVRIFETKTPTQEEEFRLVLFSFYGNKEGKQRWEPLTTRELSSGPLDVLKALKAEGIQVDSMVTTSLGNMTFEGLKHFDDHEMLPSTLVINRGMASAAKTANQLCPFPFNYLLHKAAQLTDLDADPEKEMLKFLRNTPYEHKVIMIEASQDFYFSGKGGFDPNIHDTIERLGNLVFRAKFFPFPFHNRAHHALSLDHLVFNLGTEEVANTVSFSTLEGEKMSSVLAREVFLKSGSHTCFCVSGNDATLDLATARDVVPLLLAYIEERQEMERGDNSQDEMAI